MEGNTEEKLARNGTDRICGGYSRISMTVEEPTGVSMFSVTRGMRSRRSAGGKRNAGSSAVRAAGPRHLSPGRIQNLQGHPAAYASLVCVIALGGHAPSEGAPDFSVQEPWAVAGEHGLPPWDDAPGLQL